MSKQKKAKKKAVAKNSISAAKGAKGKASAKKKNRTNKNKGLPKRLLFKNQDPFKAREKEKYSDPIPSREFIIQYLEHIGIPVKRIQIAEAIGLSDDPDAREAFRHRLKAMIRDGQILKNRSGNYLVINERDLIRGWVQGSRDGYGYLFPDDGGEKVYLSPHEMRSILNGDKIICRFIGYDRKGLREGAFVEIVERKNSEIVGRFFQDAGFGIVVPENKRISQDVLVTPENRGAAKDGQIVVAKIIEQPTRHRQPLGKITEVLGDFGAPGMEIDIASRVHGIPVDWPHDVDEQIAAIEEEVSESDKQGRVDLRDFNFVTIDGEDARDFDDAVFCKKTASGWKLYVAIADVSHYVLPDSPLDTEACHRGTSVYFPAAVIPMLPEKLSNGLCSLNPKVDRLTLVCEMLINDKGLVSRSRFYKAVIHSSARMTYVEAAAILFDNCSETTERYRHLLADLVQLKDVYKALLSQRKKRGAIDFDTVETKIIYDENRQIKDIVPTVRNEAHMLIEECMIAANVASSSFLIKHRIPGLFRDHEEPKDSKLENLYQFLGQMGLQLGKGSDSPTPKDFSFIIGKVKDRPDYNLIQTILLRSLSQAEYRAENSGHFGLALESYSHFTSPIRRYPDLLVHRAISHIIAGGKPCEYHYSKKMMEEMGRNCSMTERRADEASRDVIFGLKCHYMKDRIGEEYEGIISGVTSFGVFVEIIDLYVEGLIHVTGLGNDYFHYDPVRHEMSGERTRKRYRLGDQVKIKVVRVDVEERKIDFELLN